MPDPFSYVHRTLVCLVRIRIHFFILSFAVFFGMHYLSKTIFVFIFFSDD